MSGEANQPSTSHGITSNSVESFKPTTQEEIDEINRQIQEKEREIAAIEEKLARGDNPVIEILDSDEEILTINSDEKRIKNLKKNVNVKIEKIKCIRTSVIQWAP